MVQNKLGIKYSRILLIHFALKINKKRIIVKFFTRNHRLSTEILASEKVGFGGQNSGAIFLRLGTKVHEIR